MRTISINDGFRLIVPSGTVQLTGASETWVPSRYVCCQLAVDWRGHWGHWWCCYLSVSPATPPTHQTFCHNMILRQRTYCKDGIAICNYISRSKINANIVWECTQSTDLPWPD